MRTLDTRNSGSATSSNTRRGGDSFIISAQKNCLAMKNGRRQRGTASTSSQFTSLP